MAFCSGKISAQISAQFLPNLCPIYAPIYAPISAQSMPNLWEIFVMHVIKKMVYFVLLGWLLPSWLLLVCATSAIAAPLIMGSISS